MSNQAINDNAINEVLKSINYMIQTALKKTTQCYNGLVVSSSNNGKWNVQYNGEVHSLPVYGAAVPTLNNLVKVIIPQGNQALAWFFVPVESSSGGDGTTFIPSVSNDGIISWTNDGGLPNPTPVNIMGPQGEQGKDGDVGPQGIQGEPGAYFTPSVSSGGDLSWTNNGGLVNPATVNIKGPQGIQGNTGYYFTPSVSNNGDLSWSNNGNLDNPSTVNIKGPQGIQGEQGIQGKTGDVGPYYTPSVDSSGNLSWTNNGGLNNPTPVNIKGPQGIQGEVGEQGEQGEQGEPGYYFTPSVSSSGDLSWTNNGSLQNPATVNIMGPQGNIGPQGLTGADGKSAYDYAQQGGYTGTESEFASDLAGLKSGPFLPLSGGTLTGNLTGKYVTGTWLQGTASNQLSSTPPRICVQDSEGWIYSRTPSQILGDIGAAPNYTYSTTDLTAGSSSLATGTIYLVYE